MIYIFYRITHTKYPELNYVGSTINTRKRIHLSNQEMKNEKIRSYNRKISQFVRNNYINFIISNAT